MECNFEPEFVLKLPYQKDVSFAGATQHISCQSCSKATQHISCQFRSKATQHTSCLSHSKRVGVSRVNDARKKSSVKRKIKKIVVVTRKI